MSRSGGVLFDALVLGEAAQSLRLARLSGDRGQAARLPDLGLAREMPPSVSDDGARGRQRQRERPLSDLRNAGSEAKGADQEAGVAHEPDPEGDHV